MTSRTTLVLAHDTAETIKSHGGATTLLLRPVVGDDYTVIGRLDTVHESLAVTIGGGDADITVNWTEGRVTGTVPHPDGTERHLDAVRLVGDRIHILLGDERKDLADLFGRQVLAFGADGQLVLGHMHIGVVGAGGTGSAVCEQLIRLGVGHITVIDPDIITDTNVTRVWGSTLDDIDVRKVDIVARSAATIGTGTTVTAVHDTIANEAAARALRHCDVIFGCTDDNVGRLVLSRLAYIHLIPVLDMGVRIDTDGDHITAIDARITYMAPGSACLDCRGWIDHERLAAEALPDDEGAALEAEGYVIGLGEPDPSVIPYTTVVAAHAVADLLNRLFGFSPAPNDQILQFHAHTIRTPGRPARDGHFCTDPFFIGAGELDPFLDRPWAS
jgi:hypothetical protein